MVPLYITLLSTSKGYGRAINLLKVIGQNAGGWKSIRKTEKLFSLILTFSYCSSVQRILPQA